METYQLASKYSKLMNGCSQPKFSQNGASIEDMKSYSHEFLADIDQEISKIVTMKNEQIYEIIDTELSNFSKNRYNKTIEILVIFYCSRMLDFTRRFPPKANAKIYYIMFKYYPYLIYSSMFDKTVDDQLNFIQAIDDIDSEHSIRIEKYSTNMEKYKKYLENYYSEYDKHNVCINFNNFIGIEFKTTGIDYSEFKKLCSSCLIVHVGFNNSFDNVLYKSYPGIKSNFLNYQDMLKFKIFEEIKTHESNKCYELMENGKIVFEKMKGKEENAVPILGGKADLGSLNLNEYAVAICYDDSEKIENCHFSVSKNRLNGHEIQVLINGGIIRQIPFHVYKLYLSKMFYIRMNMIKDEPAGEKDVETATQELRMKISKLVGPCFDEDYKKCIEKWIKEFPDEKYLETYLQGLRINCLDVQTGKLIFEKYYEWIKNYFFPVIM